MQRRAFLRRTTTGLLAVACVAGAQPGRSAPRVALLLPAEHPLEAPFRDGLRALGYAEGRDVVLERHSADGDFARLPALAAAIVRSGPDVIVPFLTQAAVAARAATAAIPIVMVAVSDPVGAALVADLARPGGNVTGTAGLVAAVIGKQLEMVRELVPAATRVATLWNPSNAVFQAQMADEARAAAVRLGLRLTFVEARRADALDRALGAIAAQRPDAVLVFGEPLFVANAQRIADALTGHRLVAVGGARAYAEQGMLASYAPDLAWAARRAAAHVDRILRGARPQDLPVELATRFELVLNAGTARRLGVSLPPALVARADAVVE